MNLRSDIDSDDVTISLWTSTVLKPDRGASQEGNESTKVKGAEA